MNRIFSVIKWHTPLTRLGHKTQLLTNNSLFSFKPYALNCRLLSHQRAIEETIKPNTKNDPEDVAFGIGGKYVELDKRKTELRVDHSYKATRKVYKSGQESKLRNEDESDQFGTLAQDPEQILEQSGLDLTVDYSRSSVDKQEKESVSSEEEELEKKYDQVFNHIRLKNGPEHHNTEWDYVKQLQPLLEANKTKEALDFFFLKMIEKDRFKPTLYLFKMMIQHTAQIGYTHMAFSLFKKLTSMHEDDWSKQSVKLHKIMTLLFLACARSPYPQYAIQKTDAIRRYLSLRSIDVNTKTYSAMIQAYGRQGAVYEAFNVVDEMLAKKLKLDSSIFANLMSACLSSPEYGFKYALMTWQMSLKYKIKPDLRMFHLLLKAASDCHATGVVSDTKALNGRLQLNQFKPKIQAKNERLTAKSEATLEIEKETNKTELDVIEEEQASSSNVVVLSESDVKLMNQDQDMADKLTEQIMKLEWWQDIRSNIDQSELKTQLERIKNPELREAIIQNASRSSIDSNYGVLIKKQDQNAIEGLINDQLSKKSSMFDDRRPGCMDNSANRLKLLGDVSGVLEAVSKFNVQPDCKFFNIMIQILPADDRESESIMMQYMSKHEIKPDIDFINFLLKRCILRRNYQEADQAFEMIQKNRLTPNIRTFGSLAYRVHNLHNLKEFLNNVKSFKLDLNVRIASTLYSIGFKRGHTAYLIHLVTHLIENQIELSDYFLRKIDSDLKSLQSSIIEMERKNLTSQKEEHEKMNKFYQDLKEMRQRLRESGKMPRQVPPHPYSRLARQDMPLFKSHIRMTQDLKVNYKN